MKKSAGRKSLPEPVVTPEERYHLINDAAYFRALKQGQAPGKSIGQAASWCEVESEIDAVLQMHDAPG